MKIESGACICPGQIRIMGYVKDFGSIFMRTSCHCGLVSVEVVSQESIGLITRACMELLSKIKTSENNIAGFIFTVQFISLFFFKSGINI